MRLLRSCAVALILTMVPVALPLLAQVPALEEAGFGPLDTSPLTGVTPEEIIRRFAAKESEFRQARDHYTYRQEVKMQTIDDSGKVDGEYRQTSDIVFTPAGKREERVVFAPQNSLERITLTPEDMQDIEQRLPFVLTAEDIGQYNLTYVGKQAVDELKTYAFDVAPKVMEKNKRYFQGRIWVDQQDMQIVLTSGKNVPDDTRKGHENLSPPFTTYREQIDGKYWFPTYTKSDATLHFKGGSGYLSEDVRVRQIVRYTNYKQFGSSVRILYGGQDITNSGESGSQAKTPNSAPNPQPSPGNAPSTQPNSAPAPPRD